MIVAYLIVSFPFQYTQEKMNDVSQPVRWLGTLLFFIIACYIVRYRKKLEAVFAKKSLFFIIFVMIFALQLMTIYLFKIQPVNDLLYLLDEAIQKYVHGFSKNNNIHMLASFIFLTMRIAIYPHKIPISITYKFKKFPARYSQ